MSEEIKKAYPLSWPSGWKRTISSDRKNGRFNRKEPVYRSDGSRSYNRSKGLTVSDGVQRVLETLEAMGVNGNDIVISTNIKTRLDGLPRSGEKEPDDPGAAVYWRERHDSPTRCMAIDIYATIADTLAAIAATLAAMRAIERHGGAEIPQSSVRGLPSAS